MKDDRSTLQLFGIKALIERKGWTLPSVNNFGGFPLFLDGIGLYEAILEICVMSKHGKETIRRLSHVVDPQGRGTSLEIVEWEERCGRTQADILAALDQAIAEGRKAA